MQKRHASLASQTILIGLIAALMLAAAIYGQGQRGGARGGPPAGSAGVVAGRGAGRGAAPAAPAPKALIPNAKPVRSCESLASLALPNTTIESAAVDPNNPAICRVTAIT